MIIDILSLFPSYFDTPLEQSLVKRARDKGIVEFNAIDIRQFATDKHQKVDDRPFGGGPGMIMMPEPICLAIRSRRKEGSHVIYLSPQGKMLTSKRCMELAKCPHLILLCGHYEGIDERAIHKEVDEEISIGDYVLMSGCPAALVISEAICRFIPGVLGNEASPWEDSFQERPFKGPQYTRPESFEGDSVPQVLREGNHAIIEKWRLQEAMKKLEKNRPELGRKI